MNTPEYLEVNEHQSTKKKQQRRFIYILETPNEKKELDIDDADLIENADGDLDCPLDQVLSRYKLELADLFTMKVATVSFVKECDDTRKTIRSISFEHLRYNK